MNKQFVQVLTDIRCNWQKSSPRYRVYVGGELFTERTWIWKDMYLEELLQINAAPGEYLIEYQLLKPHKAELHISNMRILLGDAYIKDGNILVIR